MHKFSWYEAKSVADALQQVNTSTTEEMYNPTGKAALLKAGGVDLWDLVKEGLVKPSMVVNIRNIPGLDRLRFDEETGLRLGANLTLADMEEDETIRERYQALHQAVAKAATPQLRNMATLGGNLAQRTRCWYFRSPDHHCFRKGGDRCFARNGENENHAILENGSCVSLHASSVATALMAFDARVVIVNSQEEVREVPMIDFFLTPAQDISRECALEVDDIITEIIVPAPSKKVKSYYIKQGARESYDWSLADVAVVLEMDGSTCSMARVVLGAAAPVPLRSMEAEEVLTGNRIDEGRAKEAALAAMSKARPLDKNGYKIPLFESIIQRAILQIA